CCVGARLRLAPGRREGAPAGVAPPLVRGWIGGRSLVFRPPLGGSVVATSLRPPAAPFGVYAAVVASSPGAAPLRSLCVAAAPCAAVRSFLHALRRVRALRRRCQRLRRVVFWGARPRLRFPLFRWVAGEGSDDPQRITRHQQSHPPQAAGRA